MITKTKDYELNDLIQEFDQTEIQLKTFQIVSSLCAPVSRLVCLEYTIHYRDRLQKGQEVRLAKPQVTANDNKHRVTMDPVSNTKTIKRKNHGNYKYETCQFNYFVK